MSLRHFAAVIIGCQLLTACSSPPPPVPAGMALLRAKAMRGEGAKTFDPHLVIREIDNRPLDHDDGEVGVPITPGNRTVLVSMISHTGSTLGALNTTDPNRRFEDVHRIHFEHVLRFKAEEGHTYQACVLDTGLGFRYWIEDETARRIVAGSKDW